MIVILCLIIFTINLIVFKKINNYDYFLKSSRSIRDVNTEFFENYKGVILILEKENLEKEADYYYKIYSKLMSKYSDVGVFTFNLDLNDHDIECFQYLNVTFFPCAIKIEQDKDKKFTFYDMESI